MIASIIGATGYTGGELLRLLLNHNKVEIGTLTFGKLCREKGF